MHGSAAASRNSTNGAGAGACKGGCQPCQIFQLRMHASHLDSLTENPFQNSKRSERNGNRGRKKRKRNANKTRNGSVSRMVAAQNSRPQIPISRKVRPFHRAAIDLNCPPSVTVQVAGKWALSIPVVWIRFTKLAAARKSTLTIILTRPTGRASRCKLATSRDVLPCILTVISGTDALAGLLCHGLSNYRPFDVARLATVRYPFWQR